VSDGVIVIEFDGTEALKQSWINLG